jgi:hypothetical protein
VLAFCVPAVESSGLGYCVCVLMSVLEMPFDVFSVTERLSARVNWATEWRVVLLVVGIQKMSFVEALAAFIALMRSTCRGSGGSRVCGTSSNNGSRRGTLCSPVGRHKVIAMRFLLSLEIMSILCSCQQLLPQQISILTSRCSSILK